MVALFKKKSNETLTVISVTSAGYNKGTCEIWFRDIEGNTWKNSMSGMLANEYLQELFNTGKVDISTRYFGVG